MFGRNHPVTRISMADASCNMVAIHRRMLNAQPGQQKFALLKAMTGRQRLKAAEWRSVYDLNNLPTGTVGCLACFHTPDARHLTDSFPPAWPQVQAQTNQ